VVNSNQALLAIRSFNSARLPYTTAQSPVLRHADACFAHYMTHGEPTLNRLAAGSGVVRHKAHLVSLPYLPWLRMDPAGRRRLRNRALVGWAILAGVFLVLSIPNGPPPSTEFFLLWLASMVGALALAGLPFAFAREWLRSRRQRLRQRRQAVRPASAVPFRYTGRRWKSSAGMLMFCVALIATVWLLPAPDEAFSATISAVFRWLFLAFAALVVPASFLRALSITFEVDDIGVRVHRPFRAFDTRWEANQQEEDARFPRMPLPFMPDDVRLPEMFALWGKDGAVAGVVAPSAELGAGDREAFESALVQYAGEHGLPVVEVSWRATRSWKRRRRSTPG